MKTLTGGICGSVGYGSGVAALKPVSNTEVPKYIINDCTAEVERFRNAQTLCEERINKLLGDTENHEENSLDIMKAYRMILRDESFFKKALNRLEPEKLNIEYLVYDECQKVVIKFEALNDPYLRERATDIENVCNELIDVMLGREIKLKIDASIGDNIIIVADDLTPSETITMDKTLVSAIVTERGGKTSHTVILAKTLGIPAIVGLKGVTGSVSDGDLLLVDAFRGAIIINPDKECKSEFMALSKDYNNKIKQYAKSSGEPAITLDGRKIDVNINTGDKESISSFDANKCDGIGLLRTEFLYMNRNDYPDEDTQFAVYRDLAGRAEGKQVIIRTLDIGGDKQVRYLDLPKEDNPVLGYRAIRLCLTRPDVFHTQLRAILRASNFGNVKIMFPMIVNVEELRQARVCMNKAKESLRQDGILFNEDIPTGIMIETPAAVLICDKLALESDFFSVGSNDLIQYITATDRMNENVQYLHDSYNLSVLKAIKIVAESAQSAGIPWGICGEVASEEKLIPLWVALGVSELSVPPGIVGRIKHLIRKMDSSKIESDAQKIFDLETADEVSSALDALKNDLKTKPTS